jgi:two-component system chemotaxis sensor kinase CheA
VALDASPGDNELINTAFRSFHTIKGSSDYLGMTAMKEFARHIEDILGAVRSKKSALTSPVITALLETCDALRHGSAQLRGAGKFNLERFNLDISIIYKNFSITMMDGSINENDSVKNSGEVMYDFSGEKGGKESLEIRIDQERFNTFMANLGEILALEPILRLNINEIAARLPEKSAAVENLMSNFSRAVERLKESAYGLKMLPLKNAFMKMYRLTRDLSVKSGKKLKLITSGGEVEMDREIVESIAEPIMHIIRNSCDHGIESGPERAAAGKPAAGMINITAALKEGSVTISISDDGRGIDAQKVLKKAAASGLIKGKENLTDDEVYKLIMSPGFSTAEKISDISGRGVGMDVVAKAVKKLGGSVRIKSISGQGIKVSMKLPVLLAVIEALIVEIAGQKYAIALENTGYISNCVEEPAGGCVICANDEKIRAVDISAGKSRSKLYLVVLSGGKKAALKVDRIHAQGRIAVKNIETLKLKKTLFSGATVLPDGQPALILSAERIINAV